ncbi:MAG: hypothetical protein E7131_06620 [Rikenellaceae bacterium]|nr:hypothetical protein [Rikenellaceae bacterium]
MKTLLFPHRFQKVGWVIFALAAALGVYLCITEFEGFGGSYTMNNIAIIGIAIGGILATCSKEKVEDEMISHIRLNSLLVALYINYAVLIVASLLVYDLDFLQVMIYQMFTILLVFMVVFRYQVWRAKGGADDEE